MGWSSFDQSRFSTLFGFRAKLNLTFFNGQRHRPVGLMARIHV
jgi:hypothetical protein